MKKILFREKEDKDDAVSDLKKKGISVFCAECILLLCFGLRGSALMFSKIVMNTVPPMTLLGLRFLISFVFLVIICYKKVSKITGKEMFHAAVMGFLLFVIMGFENFGLKTTAASTTAFIENCAVVFVPVIMACLNKHFPERDMVFTVVLALLGISFLTLKGAKISLTYGELLIFGATIAFSINIIVTGHFSKEDNPFVIGVWQLLFAGILSLGCAFIFEDVNVPSAVVDWLSVLYLSVLCSGLGYSLQPIAQEYTTAERTSLLAVSNPIVASVLGFVFLKEPLTLYFIIGVIFILISVLYIPLKSKYTKNRF